MEPLFSLEGKVALVTGASRGLGQGMAMGLAKAGATVIGAGLSGSSDTKEKIEALGGIYHELTVDLSDLDEPVKLAKQAIAITGRVDILINNAGIIRRKPAAEYTDADWFEVININQNAVFLLCREIGKHMIEKGSGKIINIASMLSYQGGLTVPSYAASKHAVAGITKSLANEWSSKGVNVNAIAPGYMATDNTAPIRNNPDRKASIESRIPQGRWGTPEDLQGAAIFLASDASNYVNGHVLCVDGGWMGS
ncbi:2-dehydro-3-deoxy-D-gluconate 5-dehydrogenase KduD [Aquibacillus rhizosphaerae]|uniref:2-dehydro-3-deoxy-D-gluconate 5-dehydrogenase KduD n=1 Tax=Aquibacillus rhizosphaerae TaxID=3051431 RepID=A0ABT7L385_9BACI|nr:2-dehydro-3-deoxy-D-gluconate 5-dehydrogenase KduD [Aquibacillus sp. LR5S19]MDL4840309.1 2-dehydro-3-deoxy-D-gluconate 5-dehydrogenase KduD [Aquibacillus sp. LR5S19]